jgi:cell division inhibitor SepF
MTVKLFDKLLSALGIYEYVEVEEDDTREETAKPRERPSLARVPAATDIDKPSWLNKNKIPAASESAPPPAKKKNNVIPFQASNPNIKFVVMSPRMFDDAQVIADHIRMAKPVVVNFVHTETDTMKRIIDFISGTVYALNGTIKLVGDNIMVCAPNNVDIEINKDLFSK